ncbi:uncharacterized protein LOC102707722 [Oryza brachyantha]|uniref:Oxidative stress 3 n=1 Tax=Oryza brachyantha TaxID=4533 RepID=J3L3W7_ORYBR|nr:uncharacterized protein LOC102707722 [Oryza brachyantha]
MSKFGGAAVLPVYHEEEDEDLFETSSSISGDSDDEAQFSDSEEAEAQEYQFAQQAASQATRLNSVSLYDLSSMMAQLPVKKGLSKYYDGKSQSFACLSEVRCLEDLRKKESPYKKIKSSKSYVALDGNQQACHIPGANSTSIAKKSSGSSCANLMARNNTKNMLYRPPPIPVHKNGYHQ